MGFREKSKLSLRIFTATVLIAIAFSTIYPGVHFTSTTYSNSHIVILSWDGVERTVLWELLRNGSLPNLSKLNVYNLTCNLEYGMKTTTNFQYSAMLTGYLNNVTRYDVMGTKSLFFRVHRLMGKEYSIVGFTAKPQYLAPYLIGVDKKQVLAGLYLNINGFDEFVSAKTNINPPTKTMPEGAMETVLNLASANRSKFLYFFQFADPDASGHGWGVDSWQYKKAIKDCDMVLGKLVSKLPSDTVYIVNSDHGFGDVDKYSHINDPNTFIASNLKLRNGYQVDVAATIYDILEIDTSQFTPRLHGVSLLSEESNNIFCDGFESGDFSRWSGTKGLPQVWNTISHHGIYSCRTDTVEYLYKTITATNEIYVRFYVRIELMPSTDRSEIAILRVYNAGSNPLCIVKITNFSGTAKWVLRTREAGALISHISNQQINPSSDTWYSVEVRVDCSSSDGETDGNYQVWIDNSELTDIARLGKDTDYTSANTVQVGQPNSNYAVTNYVDCMLINNTYTGAEG